MDNRVSTVGYGGALSDGFVIAIDWAIASSYVGGSAVGEGGGAVGRESTVEDDIAAWFFSITK